MSEEFRLPDLGEGIEGGDIVSVLVSEGDKVQAEQSILELETDKAVVELPCPFAGRIVKVHVSSGDAIAIGDLVLTIELILPADVVDAPADESPGEESSSDENASVAEEPSPAPVAETPPVAVATASKPPIAAVSAVAPTGNGASSNGRPPAPAGPATRRLARQLGVEIYDVAGTGPSGRITRDDIKDFVKSGFEERAAGMSNGQAPVALPDFSQWGEVDVEPLKGIRKKTAEAMSLAWRTIPHVTQFDQADITELEAARKRFESTRTEGGKITMTVLALKACVAALEKFPQFRSSIDEARGQIVYKRYHHIGVAIDTEHGLLVPVIRDVDKKSLGELAVELTEIAGRARSRKIDLEELRGGVFTITNLGGIGGTAFTPIVNHPEVAILGISRGKREVVLEQGEPQERLMLPICLSYDHRAIDGANGARFLRYLAGLLADPFQLMLEI
jgi:pyruvate dehydrogenase E2 component (dihydrolipoamide acetyltransferase)